MIEQLQIAGRGLDITEAIHQHLNDKLGRLERFSDQITGGRVTLSHFESKSEARRNRAEIQMNLAGGVVRAEEAGEDMYAAIDKAITVLERQLRKRKERIVERRAAAPTHSEMPSESGDDTDFMPEIVRTKHFEMRPMTPEDAAFALEDLGHAFYVFHNANTDRTAVVYRRQDGHFGLIEPKH